MINIFKQEVNWRAVAYDNEILLSKINKLLTANLRIICDYILKIFPEVTSIYLLNSFSRGEASVLIENGKIKFLSDYDIFVISSKPLYILQLREKIFEKTFSLYKLNNIEFMPGHPVVDLKVMSKRQIFNSPPSLFKHELKTATCIYGSEVLDPPPKVDPKEIPLTEGLSLLFNRIFGALIPFRTNFLNSSLTRLQRRHLTFETAKLITGCRDAMLILDGFFGLTEKDKQDYFRLNYYRYRWLERKVPEFLTLTEKAYLYRIMPYKELENEALDLWFESQVIASEVLKLYLRSLYGIINNDWPSIADALLRKNFYDYWYRLYVPFLSFRARTEKKRLDLVCVKDPNRVLIALILLAFSVSKDGVNELMLKKAKELIAPREISTSCKGSVEEDWTFLKEAICANYIMPFSRQSFSVVLQAAIGKVLEWIQQL